MKAVTPAVTVSVVAAASGLSAEQAVTRLHAGAGRHASALGF